jgi:hypothetical protein
MLRRPRARVYVNGFNFYYAAFDRSRGKFFGRRITCMPYNLYGILLS